jgi:hypothetical protein
MRPIKRGDGVATLELSDDELRTINNALNEICGGPEAIDEAEFHTRVGATRDDALRLLASIQRLLDG